MTRAYPLTVEALDAVGDPITLRYSLGDYHADGENWPRRVVKPSLFAGAARMPWLRSGGRQNVGDIELGNADGGLDALVDYALDGRAATQQSWDGETLRTEVTGTVSRVEIERRIVRLILRDEAEFLAEDHPQDSYLGDGSPLEGDGDIAGNPKPQVLGSVVNATPVQTSYGLQIYQVSSLADCIVPAARDRAVPLTHAGEYASEAELIDEALTPAPGTFRSWRGFVRLGDTAQALTVDAHQSLTTAQAIAEHLVTAAGGTFEAVALSAAYELADGSQYELADGSVYHITINPMSPECGIYLDAPRSTASMLDELAASIGGYWLMRDHVRFRPLRIGTPVATIPAHRVLDIRRQRGGAGENGLPVHRIVVGYDRVATTQTDVAAAATSKARWASEYRRDRAEDTAVKQRHPLSTSLRIDTARRSPGLASTLLALLGQRRDTSTVTTRLDLYSEIEIGDTITVQHPRFGYEAGRDMLVIGRTPDVADNSVALEVWG